MCSRIAAQPRGSCRGWRTEGSGLQVATVGKNIKLTTLGAQFHPAAHGSTSTSPSCNHAHSGSPGQRAQQQAPQFGASPHAIGEHRPMRWGPKCSNAVPCDRGSGPQRIKTLPHACRRRNSRARQSSRPRKSPARPRPRDCAGMRCPFS
jgi:hypothetical protein